jgi:enamine deaminase RidA (YjgF/YER057c/UK114 family)
MTRSPSGINREINAGFTPPQAPAALTLEVPPMSTTASSYRARSIGGADDALWLSGHSASPAWPYFESLGAAAMGVAEQTVAIYRSIEEDLQLQGLTLDDVMSVTEYVPLASLRSYGEIEGVRTSVLGERHVPVRTKVVHQLMHPSAVVEIEVSARKGAVLENVDGSRWHRSAVADADEIVTLPTMLPIDEEGRIVAAGDIVGQYAYCLERAGRLLEQLGLSLANVVRTLDYSTPPTMEQYPHDLRKEVLGPVYPCAFGILNNEMQVPGVLVAVDIVASRLPAEVVNPGWHRYDGLSYNPALKVGRRLLMSGTVSLDQVKAWPMHYGNVVDQAELVYSNIGAMLAAAGAGPQNLVKLNEYLVPEAVDRYPEVSAIRQHFLGDTAPALTTVVCSRMQWPVFMLEVVPTAVLDD